ncbi:hypothetical protein BKA69DRAFT_1127258 [Paraphysoderma sedebokerense]|nr:hypothetical protein BKA69DRAFT_1041141 [Paraphysoderma sedebokerense]KAI9138614.1 hypothetical protein BKA69DRAFT_1127258 [Paraphysoderma sedebokerense]
MAASHRHFSHLFRASRIATFDPLIPQVYATSPSSSKQGDWGIKQRIPPKFGESNKHITIKSQDSQYNIPIFKNAKAKVDIVKRWKENFEFDIIDQKPHHQTPLDRLPLPSDADAQQTQPKRQPTTNVLKLSRSQFQDLVAKVASHRQQFQSDYLSHKTSRDSWTDYLHLDFNPFDDTSLRPHGPNYSSPSFSDTSSTHVQGRILSKLHAQDFTVGVSGVTALLSHHSRSHDNRDPTSSSKNIQEFNVVEAFWDDKGRPVLKLSSLDKSRNFVTGNWARRGKVMIPGGSRQPMAFTTRHNFQRNDMRGGSQGKQNGTNGTAQSRLAVNAGATNDAVHSEMVGNIQSILSQFSSKEK